ncbi:MAG: hypothetical protein JSR17_12395 [Proteobacteria bacterium]|nr:hypothetical protein [Pseudomonadota bacterium]
MRCHFIQHAHFETPGSLSAWAVKHNLKIALYHPYQNDPLPVVTQGEPVIFLGGPQSATEYQRYAYLEKEVTYIRELVKLKQPMVGICLGAQLIGESLGAKCLRSPEKEVGVFPIKLTEKAKHHPYFKGLPQTQPVMHWHNDMPGLTKSANVLATSEGCPRQIIEYAPNILGFQCHFEANDEWLGLLLENASNDLKPSRFTQSVEAMHKSDFKAMNLYLETILDRWFQASTSLT